MILENIDIDIDINMVILENIIINIDIDKAILQNIESIQIWHIEQGYGTVSNKALQTVAVQSFL